MKLFYLTHIKKQSKGGRVPFKEKDLKAFERVDVLTSRMNLWHKLSFIPFSIGSLSGYFSAISLLDAGDEPSIFIPATVGLVSGVAVNYYSKWLTGTLPNDLSDAQNEKQNTIVRIKNNYDDLGFELLHLYFSSHRERRLMAQELAHRIHRKRIRSHLTALDEDQKHIALGIFEASIEYIKSGTMPTSRIFMEQIKQMEDKYDLSSNSRRSSKNISTVVDKG